MRSLLDCQTFEMKKQLDSTEIRAFLPDYIEYFITSIL